VSSTGTLVAVDWDESLASVFPDLLAPDWLLLQAVAINNNKGIQ
jgi:hypothetical protein